LQAVIDAGNIKKQFEGIKYEIIIIIIIIFDVSKIEFKTDLFL